jgi:hypothetical protein
VRALLAAGARTDAVSMSGTALDVARGANQAEVAELLAAAQAASSGGGGVRGGGSPAPEPAAPVDAPPSPQP